MTVTPHRTALFQTRSDLFQFLAACQQKLLEKSQPAQIVSITQKVDWVDPLTVLNQLACPQQLSFYFEKKDPATEDGAEADPGSNSRIAIAAFGTAAQLQTEGPDRFDQAQQFVHATLARTIAIGETQLPLTGPHFFCGFTFFDRVAQTGQWRDSAFAAATVLLPAWQIVRQQQGCFVVANLMIAAETQLESVVEQWWATLQKIRTPRYPLPILALSPPALFRLENVTDPDRYRQAVRSALAEIGRARLHKVVQAHAVDVFSLLPFNLTHSLHNLRLLYPDCYVFAIGNGQGQTFIGASPERLVSLQQRHLTTDALAGSAPRGATVWEDAQIADRLLLSPKELHEHQVVSQFITQQLIRLGLSPQRLPLRLLQLTNIQHLHTPIHAIVRPEVSLLEIVAALHPTPAMAGVPRELAYDHIRQHEGFERSLYAAPIGWLDHRGNGEFVVGIRSALLNGCTARLFAGAGIVAGSTPDHELAEVQLKLQPLLSALV